MTSTARTPATRSRFKGRRLALTLIEVLAALLILGGSVTTMVVAQAGSVASLETSRLQLTAQHAARELIAAWKIEKEDLTVPATGGVRGTSDWTWRRSSHRMSIVEGVTVIEVTLRLVHIPSTNGREPWIRAYRWWIPDETR